VGAIAEGLDPGPKRCEALLDSGLDPLQPMAGDQVAGQAALVGDHRQHVPRAGEAGRPLGRPRYPLELGGRAQVLVSARPGVDHPVPVQEGPGPQAIQGRSSDK
jgi:hypothetical protein